jgi:hypothetical protein
LRSPSSTTTLGAAADILSATMTWSGASRDTWQQPPFVAAKILRGVVRSTFLAVLRGQGQGEESGGVETSQSGRAVRLDWRVRTAARAA